MDARDDPTYLRLYRDYAKAIQAFENATKDRRRVRDRLTVQRLPMMKVLQQMGRRPVGSPFGTRAAPPRSTPSRAPRGNRAARRIYLGEILGWATLVPTPGCEPAAESDSLDVDKLYDEISKHLYWNAKAHYLRAKRAFFDYVRRSNIAGHEERARNALQHGANMQWLGMDSGDDPAFLSEAQEEVEAACRNAWGLYQSAGRKKPWEMKVLLLESIANAQFVGLDSPTVQQMTTEMYRLESKNELQRNP